MNVAKFWAKEIGEMQGICAVNIAVVDMTIGVFQKKMS